MESLVLAIKGFLQQEEGASAVEYGVLVALIIVAVIVIIAAIGQQLQNAFAKVRDCLKTPASCT